MSADNRIIINESEELTHLKTGNCDCYIFNAGNFKSDGGAAMGIYPKTLWEKKITPDQKNRIGFSTNLLLVKTDRYNLLVDSGIGYYPDEKIIKVYQPEPSRLLDYLAKCGYTREDIDYVVLTHLHQDHIGGLLYREGEQEMLMFPRARHIVQKREWDMAMAPDELNQAAYYYNKPLHLLQDSPNLMLINGDYELDPEISLILTGGHSAGTQIVRIFSKGELCYYAGDIIPHEMHLFPTVTSAYDLERQQTYASKKRVIAELQEKEGILIFNHQPEKKYQKFPLS